MKFSQSSSVLSSSANTKSVLLSVFQSEPQYDVFNKNTLVAYTTADQLPSQFKIDQQVQQRVLVKENSVSALPFAAMIHPEILSAIATEDIASSATSSGTIRLVLDLRSNVDLDAFKARTVEDLKKVVPEMQFMRDYAKDSSDALLQAAFPENGAASRFDNVAFPASSTNTGRIAVDVTFNANEAASLFYLSFYFVNTHDVAFVSRRPEDHPLASDEAAFIQRGVYVDGTCNTLDYQNLYGEGEFIGLADTGLDLTSSYLYSTDSPYCQDKNGDRLEKCGGIDTLKDVLAATGSDGVKYSAEARTVARYDAYADNVEAAADGHGTHLAGVIVGRANPSKSFTQCSDEPAKPVKHAHTGGVAVASKIVFYDIGNGKNSNLNPPVEDYSKMFTNAQKIGANVFTVAFGAVTSNSEYSGLYTAAATDVDKFMAENDQVLVVAAAGNSGLTEVASPAISKNALAVGSLAGSGYAVAQSSSGGIQLDGRLKPDVLAIGQYVYSAASTGTESEVTLSHCGVVEKSGTSIAAAIVSGAAALVRQYFRLGKNPGTVGNDLSLKSNLWGSTVKAVLIAGSFPVDGSNPRQGFGGVILRNVLPFENDNSIDLQVYQETVSNNVEIMKTVSVQASDEPLIVSLAWTDPPAALGARNVVINQLELEVTYITNGKTWSTIAVPQPGNAKRVRIAKPGAGTYTVSVKGAFVIDTQKFSLVITGILESTDRTEPLCCAVASFPGVGGCLSLDAVICIIFAAIIVVVLIVAGLYLCCRQRQNNDDKAKNQNDDEIHPL